MNEGKGMGKSVEYYRYLKRISPFVNLEKNKINLINYPELEQLTCSIPQ